MGKYYANANMLLRKFSYCSRDLKAVCSNLIVFPMYCSSISSIDSFTSPNTNIPESINSKLENVKKWLAAQKLCLNMLKTKYMMFHTPQNVFQNCTYLSTILT